MFGDGLVEPVEEVFGAVFREGVAVEAVVSGFVNAFPSARLIIACEQTKSPNHISINWANPPTIWNGQ